MCLSMPVVIGEEVVVQSVYLLCGKTIFWLRRNDDPAASSCCQSPTYRTPQSPYPISSAFMLGRPPTNISLADDPSHLIPRCVLDPGVGTGSVGSKQPAVQVVCNRFVQHL